MIDKNGNFYKPERGSTVNPDHIMLAFCGDAKKEMAIAATKSFSATVVMLWILALKVAQNKHLDIASETKDVYSIKSNISFFIKSGF